MIDDVTVSKMSEDEINMIAKKYSDARKSNKKMKKIIICLSYTK